MKWLTIIGGTALVLAFVCGGVETGLAVLVAMFIFM